MTRALTRTHLHSSKLIRVLADLAVVDAVEPGDAFAEKLGQWLSLHDAIALHAAHNASAAVMPSAANPVPGVAMGDEFARIRSALVASITQRGSPGVGRTQIELSLPHPGETLDAATAYEPYRRYYLAHQRDMEVSVRPLRAHVREVLARASPALRQLVAMDAVFDSILGDRESKLLGALPLLLKKRFQQLLKTHQADNPVLLMQAEGWLARFGHELQTVLLAELDVRLQPTLGLIEAFNHETNTQQ